jgi:hypothetical protein
VALSREAGSTSRFAARGARAARVNVLGSGACSVGFADVGARQDCRPDAAAATLGLGTTSASATGAAGSTLGTTVDGAA